MIQKPPEVHIHPTALCETTSVGRGTRIWAFSHVLPGARIGNDCNVCDDVFIEDDVTTGNRVTVKHGVQLWDGLRIGDDVFVGANATSTNDAFPRSKKYPERCAQTAIGTVRQSTPMLPSCLACRLGATQWLELAQSFPETFLPLPFWLETQRELLATWIPLSTT